MTDALAIYGQFDQMQRAAMALYKSGYFRDAASEAQAIVKVMAGAELGLPPFASMTGINIIQGKPTLGANVIATLVKNDRRYDYRVKVCDNTTCVLTWYENGQQTGESSFTMREAQDAGLTGKDNWKKYPSDMLFARAISRGARRYAPGIFGGSPVYTADEMGQDVDPDGYVETTVTEVTTPPEPEPEPEPVLTEPEIEYPAELAVVTNSDGIAYVSLDDKKLGHMLNGIEKALAKPNLTDDQISQYNAKHNAIRQILAIRNGKTNIQNDPSYLDSVDAGIDPGDGLPFGSK